jgi:hypothetical protein
MASTTSAQVQQLYVGLLGRAADKAGLDYWLNQLNATPATLTLENLRANIVNSQPEYKATFGTLSRVDTVTKIYNNLFGRAPDAAGLTYWSTGAGATVNVDQLTLAFITGASTADVQALTNKAIVADVYTSTAGANFVAADAAKIVAGVTNTPASVGTALAQLSDGSLSGIAVPAAVAQLKAVDAANAAVATFQTAKVAELQALNTSLVAAAKAIKATDATVEIVATTATDSNALKFAALTNATTGIAKEIADARALIGDGIGGAGVTTTAQLQVNADVKVKALADATAALNLGGTYQSSITGYQTAVTAFAAVKDVTATQVSVAEGTVGNLTANATADQKAALVKALNDTGLFTLTVASFADVGTATTTVDTIYQLVSGTGATVNATAAIETALTAYGYASLKPVVTQHKDYATKEAAVTTAANTLKAAGTADAAETTYINAVAPATVATKAVADSKVIDALETQYKAAVDGNTANTTAASTAAAALGTNVHTIVDGSTIDADGVGYTAANDVFYFGATTGPTVAAGVIGAKDFTITGAGALGTAGVDSIYVGTDYVKGAGTAVVTATGNTITGGNDAAKEVFFFQKGNDTYVVVEAKTFGSSTVTDYTLVGAANVGSPDAAVIKLTGVGIEKVSFANGVVSVA